MAQVWAAKPETGGLCPTVAIKLVRPEVAADKEYARMFIDEAAVASAIRHPNVCEILELGSEGGMLFMVLEWVPGTSLAGLLNVEKTMVRLPDEVAARIVADACAGLHAAHEAVGPDGELLGIVHRDVSPPNILVSMNGHVKVSDFGIAKARNQLHARTSTGVIKGKFAYLSPEQVLGRAVDRRTDVYALGSVLYLATLGSRPFGNSSEALSRIVDGKFPAPHDVRDDYPEELEAIVMRALDADPAKRFPTAEAMQVALEQWINASGCPMTNNDIAPIVRLRLGPERMRAVEALLGTTRKDPATGVSLPPPSSVRASSPPPTSGSERTLAATPDAKHSSKTDIQPPEPEPQMAIESVPPSRRSTEMTTARTERSRKRAAQNLWWAIIFVALAFVAEEAIRFVSGAH